MSAGVSIATMVVRGWDSGSRISRRVWLRRSESSPGDLLRIWLLRLARRLFRHPVRGRRSLAPIPCDPPGYGRDGTGPFGYDRTLPYATPDTGIRARVLRRRDTTRAIITPAAVAATPAPITPHSHTGMPDEALCDGSPSGLDCPFGVVVLLVEPSAVFVAEYFMQSEPPSERHCSTFFHAAC